MGYHSADLDQDWKFSLLDLVRMVELVAATYDGVTTGCYKVDDTTEDGFAPDSTRPASQIVKLSKYHSADYNQDGRIDANEFARFTALFNFRDTSPSQRRGYYHDNDPFSVDGFGFGSTYLSDYTFDSDHKPTITSNITPGTDYVLRCKLVGADGTTYQTTTTHNNSGLVLDELPAPGVYSAEIYWITYDANGAIVTISGNYYAQVVIGEPKTNCLKSTSTCVCGEPQTPTDEDKGQCFPLSVKISPDAPDLPKTNCNDTNYFVVSTPNETSKFYVVAGLLDSNCEQITDQAGLPILTILK